MACASAVALPKDSPRQVGAYKTVREHVFGFFSVNCASTRGKPSSMTAPLKIGARRYAPPIHVLRHVVARRQEVVRGQEVPQHVACRPGTVRLVVPHVLERRPVPRVEVDLLRALDELVRKGRIVHQGPRPFQEAEVLR